MFFPSANHPVVDLESSWIHFDLSVLLTDQKGTLKRQRFGGDSNALAFESHVCATSCRLDLRLDSIGN
jgi:hypothetical protein